MLLHSLSDYPVRPRQYGRRNRQADLLCRLQVDDELELRRLLYGKLGRLGAFENFVDVRGGASKQLDESWCVGRQSAGIDKFG